MAQPSGIGKINVRDFIRGALLAGFTALVSGIYQAINLDGFAFDWLHFKPIVLSAGSAFVAYIAKNLLTNNVGQIATQDKPTVVVSKEQAEQIK